MPAERTRVATTPESTPARILVEEIKTSCLTQGIVITPEAHSYIHDVAPGPLSIHEYPTTGGVTFSLPGDVYINAPFDEWFCEQAEARLDLGDEGLVVSYDEEELPVIRFLPLPGYLGEMDSEGRPVTDVVMSHADRIRLSPFVGCAYDCAFCDLGTMEYRGRPVEQLVEALHIASRDEALPARHVLISGGSPRRAHYGMFEEMCLGIIEATDMPVDIMMSPMLDNLEFIDKVVQAGLHGFSINIELFSEDASMLHLKGKYGSTRHVFEEFITHAVASLPPGRVRSLIIPGLEPFDETVAGVEHLASMGVDPVLSPFRPATGIALDRHAPPEHGDLVRLLREARVIVEQHDVVLGPRCLPCQHNTLTFPWDVA